MDLDGLSCAAVVPGLFQGRAATIPEGIKLPLEPIDAQGSAGMKHQRLGEDARRHAPLRLAELGLDALVDEHEGSGDEGAADPDCDQQPWTQPPPDAAVRGISALGSAWQSVAILPQAPDIR